MKDRRKKLEKISIFIMRPVTTAMIFLAVVVMGMVSLSRLSQELFPSISYPQITILTPYEGAAPEEVESLISQILEESGGAISGVKQISSISREALSMVMVRFDWGTNMDLAALEVREKIDLVKERLPRDCGEPIVMKYNPFEKPVIVLSVTGKESLLELREVCERQMKDDLEKLKGVAAAVITGGVGREILIEVDQSRLQASGLSLLDLGSVIKKSNINYPAGSIKGSFYEHLVRTIGEFETLDEISELTVLVDVPETEEEQRERQLGIKDELQEKTARLVRLSDIAQVKNVAKEKESISRHNGVENISISIKRQSGANVIDVCERVKEEVYRMNKNPSLDVKLDIAYDESVYVANSIKGVRNAAIGGGVLAFLVLLVFLRNLKISLIIATAIPISIMGVFILMFSRNISLNMISLGGLALGVGMLVDNSIVVLENIFRRQQERSKQDKKLSKQEALSLVSQASFQMKGAIISSTLTTVCVFFPMMFLSGIAGQLFKQLAFTVTFSLVSSLLIALMLVPMLSSLGGGIKESKDGQAKVDLLFNGIDNLYRRLLSKTLDNKAILVFVVIGLFLLSLVILKTVPSEFLPRLDQRQFIIKLTMEPGTSLEVTDNAVRMVEEVLLNEIKEVKDVSIKVGSDKDNPTEKAVQTLASYEGEIMVKLYSYKELKEKEAVSLFSTQDVIQRLRDIMKEKHLIGAQLEYVLQESVLKEAFEDKPIQIEIKGENLLQMGDVADQIKKELSSIKGVYSIEDDRVPSSPETKIYILKDQASLLGLSTQDIALTAHTAIKGRVFTKFKEDVTHPIDIRVRLQEEDRKNLSRIRSLGIRTAYRNVMVPLYQVARLAKGRGPTEIKRIDQRRTISVNANLYGRSVSEINTQLTGIVEKLNIPLGYNVGLSGESVRMRESFNSMKFAFLLAILLIYMIMAAQFESLWQPFIIMFTVPLSLIGISVALKLTSTSLNVVALLGAIMLGGIVVNNGIVLVDYMNHLKKKNLPLKEVILEASQHRLRPILMTTFTTVLGMIPLAIGIGEGSELRAPMAITVIGGLLSSTFLTLLFVPVLYDSVTAFINRGKGQGARVKEEEYRDG
ncbi:MAG: efflux RND transporter permease subunit [Candidatus Omnitrophota bacterium]|nr:efflux RND transporter permease subunit [Candidatus Omnitrophota bacterium]